MNHPHKVAGVRGLMGSAPMLMLALAAGFAALVGYRYDMTSGAFRNSDDAGNYLAGIAIASGNWRLHGWILAPDNYLPTDMLAVAVLHLAFGTHPILMKVEQALVWAAIGVLGTGLACAGLGSRKRAGVACLALAMLSFNIFDHDFANVFLSSVASHGFTILMALAAIAVAVARLVPTVPQAVLLCLIEAIGAFSDPIFVIIACLPIMALGALDLTERAERRGTEHGARRLGIVRIASTLAGLLLAHVSLSLIAHNGGFQSNRLFLSLAPFPQLLDHLGFGVASVARLLGAGFFDRPVNGQIVGGPAIFLLRAPLVVAFAMVCASVGRGLLDRILAWPAANGPSRSRDLEQLLWLGLVLGAVGACVTDVIVAQSCARFFYPTSVMGAILVARRFGGVPLPAVYGVAILLVSILVGIRSVQSTPAATMTIPQLVPVVDTLRRQGLAHGYGGYFEGTIVTAMSDGRSESLPLVAATDGLHTGNWFFDLERFRRAARDWHGRVFFIVSTVPGALELTAPEVARAFGPPAEIVRTGLFDVEIYDLPRGALAALVP